VSATLSNLTLDAVPVRYDSLSSTIGFALIAALALLLLVRELAPLLGRGDVRRQTAALDVAVGPLLMAFGIIVVARLATLLS
jgi:hypothetical protein